MLGDVIREYLLVNLIVLFVFVNMGIILIVAFFGYFEGFYEDMVEVVAQ